MKNFTVILVVALVFLSSGCAEGTIPILGGEPTPQTPEEQCNAMEGAEKESCFISLAQNTGNAGYCSNASDEKIAECYAGATVTAETNFCESLEDAEKSKACVLKAAEISGDYSYCSGITSGDERDMCLLNFQLESMSEHFCNQFFSADFKDACFIALAIKENNYEYCLEIRDAGYKDDCLVANAPKEKEAGSRLSDLDLRD